MIKPRLIEGWITLRGINLHPVGKAIRFVNTYLLNTGHIRSSNNS